ncbi:MAG: hypothetical protein AAFY71_27390 [Bacteroidota bacterium]
METTIIKYSSRNTFLKQAPSLFEEINYGCLGLAKEAGALYADIDILIEKQDAINWIALCELHFPDTYWQVIRHQGVIYLRAYFPDHSYLEIDLIFEARVKGIQFVDVSYLLDLSKPGADGWKRIPEQEYLTYKCLFLRLNGLSPKQIIETIQPKGNLFVETGPILRMIQSSDLKGLSRWLDQKMNKIEKELPNQWFHKLVRRLSQFKDKGKKLPPMISFSGVDGAGKSTLLDSFHELLEKKYRRRVVRLRHRPGLLPILSVWRYGKNKAHQRAKEGLPRQGNNQSTLSTTIRFTYYYLDYLLGYLIKVLPLRLKGNIILYDRYYFDFIADPRRTNLSNGASIFRKLYFFVPKVRANFLLYAPSDIILSRKKELSAEDIDELTDSYLSLFSSLSSRYREQSYQAIENIQIEETQKKLEAKWIDLNKKLNFY